MRVPNWPYIYWAIFVFIVIAILCIRFWRRLDKEDDKK
tara:strand:- start:326 stop:439 length:114 start_codon:yes stop_codon:yes gene_type:complete